MGAGFDDAAIFEHDDAVGLASLSEAVGDDDGAASFEGGSGSLLEDAGTGAARFGRRLVEDRDRRVGEDQAGEGELLRLAGGKTMRPFADLRFEALRERFRPAEGAGAMQGVAYIQRLNTKGGVAPSAACTAANKGQRQQVVYEADYVFYGS